MWADEHPANGVFLIWDVLIAHRADYTRYRKAMSLAHVSQVIFNDNRTALEQVQRFQDWNVVGLVKTANKLARQPSPGLSQTAILIGTVALAVGVGFLVVYRRRLK
jgi:hypothetical protein